MGERGVEPPPLSGQAPKACASASSATRPQRDASACPRPRRSAPQSEAPVGRRQVCQFRPSIPFPSARIPKPQADGRDEILPRTSCHARHEVSHVEGLRHPPTKLCHAQCVMCHGTSTITPYNSFQNPGIADFGLAIVDCFLRTVRNPHFDIRNLRRF